MSAVSPSNSLAAEQTGEVTAERLGGIFRLQLNRPAKKNAMTSNMYATLLRHRKP
jgi:enoyl-CoA hydratase/carnithine racemase